MERLAYLCGCECALPIGDSSLVHRPIGQHGGRAAAARRILHVVTAGIRQRSGASEPARPAFAQRVMWHERGGGRGWRSAGNTDGEIDGGADGGDGGAGVAARAAGGRAPVDVVGAGGSVLTDGETGSAACITARLRLAGAANTHLARRRCSGWTLTRRAGPRCVCGRRELSDLLVIRGHFRCRVGRRSRRVWPWTGCGCCDLCTR